MITYTFYMMKYASIQMLANCTNPTIYDLSRPLSKITAHTVQSLNKFFGQPDDGLHTGPKHVVASYILLLLVIYRPGSSVGIATDYGLDGPGSNFGGDEIFRPSRPALGPTQSPVKWVPFLGRVELYLYPPSGSHGACNGVTLPLPLLIVILLCS